MIRIFSLFLLFCLAGCADRYSLDKERGPDPQGIATANPLVLPPDYLLRAPEPAAAKKKPETPEQSQAGKTENGDAFQAPELTFDSEPSEE